MIAFYISSHGFGHLTRCMAIIDKLLELSHYSIYIACGKRQIEFAKVYYKKSDRIIYREIVTDAGLVNIDKSLEVDIDATMSKIACFIENGKEIITNESQFLRKHDVKLVISDISVIGFYIADILGVTSIGISNFTWIDQYSFLKIERELLEFYVKGYNKCSLFYKYPLALQLNGINCKAHEVGYLCREIDDNKANKIKEKHGRILFIGVGKSAELPTITIEEFEGTIICTEGVNVQSAGAARVEVLPIDIEDTQNYIAASDIVIAKAGWGTVAECMVSGVKTVLIERDSVIEDTEIINSLINQRMCISIKEKGIELINIKKLNERFIGEAEIRKHKDFSSEIASKILKEIK